MGWNPLVVDMNDVPNVDIADAEVAEEAHKIENAAGEFLDVANTLRRLWDGLGSTYFTSHTQVVLKTMDPIIETAKRAEWVYHGVAGALGAFVDEVRACRTDCNELRDAVRNFLKIPEVQIKAVVPGTPEFRQNIALQRRANVLRGNIQSAIEKCRVRLDAIGEDAHAYDPYEGLTSVDEDGGVGAGRATVHEAALDWDLYGKSGRPRGNQVDQGSLGDCWLMSSLAALADKDPGAIERMIHDNGNGTYSVTLFIDGEWQSIQVDITMLMEGDRPQFAGDGGNNDQALWPLLVEKAAIKAYGGDYLALNVGTGAMSMTMLTGNPAVDDIITPNTPWDNDAIARYSALSHADNVMMTANSNIDVFATDTKAVSVPVRFSDTRADQDPLPTINVAMNHVYQVSGIDSSGNVTLVNPWNANSTTLDPATHQAVDHDQFTVTAEQFHELFANLSVGSIN